LSFLNWFNDDVSVETAWRLQEVLTTLPVQVFILTACTAGVCRLLLSEEAS
jgi:hypothetical protein